MTRTKPSAWPLRSGRTTYSLLRSSDASLPSFLMQTAYRRDTLFMFLLPTPCASYQCSSARQTEEGTDPIGEQLLGEQAEIEAMLSQEGEELRVRKDGARDAKHQVQALRFHRLLRPATFRPLLKARQDERAASASEMDSAWASL